MKNTLSSLFLTLSLAVVLSTGNARESDKTTANLSPTLNNGKLVVDGTTFDIKGICWNPIPKGEKHPEGLAYVPGSPGYSLSFVETDLRLIAEAGFNTIRPYKAITNPEVLDLIQQHGLKVIVPVFNYYKTTDEEIRESVLALKDHPTTLLLEVGNEWNYNNLYNYQGNFDSTVKRIQEAITIIRSIDDSLLIASNYGEIPSKKTIAKIDADLWGLNIYRSDNFKNLFTQWRKVSDKPIYIGEYGADAIDNRKGDGKYAPDAQAHAVEKLTLQIISQYASQNRGQVLGGALFEFSDEWWKDGKGLASEHDIGGIAPGGGPYPDLEFNEEWWGIVDIDRNPRLAYHAIKKIYAP
ncbi:glycoside hydrolase family 2 TIM barrel-domain containing protein [Pelagicoccus mobilis]|uniref:Glycoside hydrolase family 2 catalytic domain-containing protein n=1 Tax=Pelagicoccus mobilis TaxID=415221 RepID=A0A934RYH0_9BACT|nr:glycoside hydrolase family 2 TIM barrel-domain containing protein [Pelagicoccus mobilis]MBK1877574.1 hypothetical protein [Pelagicoccus mobilis]